MAGTVVSFKSIKPKKLKIDAIRKEMLNALRKEGTQHRRILARTVTTWKNKPKFESLIGLTREDATVVTGPVGNDAAVAHWEFTNSGTKPHIIRARRAPYLSFSWPSSPKTRAKKFTSTRGRRGNNWARKKSVRHPGTKARKWTETLSKRRKPKFTTAMIQAVRKGSAKIF